MKQFFTKRFHWVVAVLVFLEMIVVGGLINSNSVFTVPICDALGVSRANYAAAAIPYNLVCTVGTMLTGAIFHRFGYKYPAILALLLIGTSMAVTGSADSLVMYGFGRALFGLGYGICFTAGATFIIRNWFSRYQGLVLGAVSMSSGLGGSLMTVLLTAIIESHTWRIASYVAAALCVLTAVLYLILSDRPEQKGLTPLGFGTVSKDAKKQPRNQYPGLEFSQLLKKPSLYLMVLCILLICCCIFINSTTIIPHFRSIGFSPSEAATFQSILMLVLAVSKLICGGMCDRFGAKAVSLVCVLCAVVGEGILGLTTVPGLCVIGILLLAIGLCMTSILIPLLAQDLFGYRAALSVNGIMLAMACFSNILASVLSGLCFDITGSYAPGYLISAGVNAGVCILLLWLYRLTKRPE